jgi:integrase
MATRRSRGDGGLHWDERRQRWIATASLGYDPAGKRIIKRGSGRTKTEAKNKLKAILLDHEDGLAIAPTDYTVGDAVRDWLTYGLVGRSAGTVKTNRDLCHEHLIPLLGLRRLRDLRAEDVERWLAGRAELLSGSTLRKLHSALNRSVNRAMARDKVRRNVVGLCSVPEGQPGRPSKSLTLAQAQAILTAARDTPLYAYVVMSLLTGARTEELRALTWDHVDLLGRPDLDPPIPPHVAVWRSVRVGGDTKTRLSRRTLALPALCVDVLSEHRRMQILHSRPRPATPGTGLVFSTDSGQSLDASHVRRSFRTVLRRAQGIDPAEWSPRELRHSFVSLLSDSGVPLEEISRLVGHSSTVVTELVYRKQLRPWSRAGPSRWTGCSERRAVVTQLDTQRVGSDSP